MLVAAAALAYLVGVLREWEAGTGERPLRVPRSTASPSAAGGRLSPAVAMGIHVTIERAFSLDWGSGVAETTQSKRDLVRRNLALAARRGFNVIVTQIWDDAARTAFFSSSTLVGTGLRRGEDIACYLAEQARQNKLTAMVDVSTPPIEGLPKVDPRDRGSPWTRW